MDLYKEIEALSLEQKDLLSLLVKQEIEAKISGHSIIPSRKENETRTELSFAQQRLWFLQKLKPADATYNTPVGLRIQGCLDITILEKVFDFLVSRHETLRLSFQELNGKTFQVVEKSDKTKIEKIDLTKIPQEERNEHLQASVRNKINTCFDLAKTPLFRVYLYIMNEDNYVLLINMHHIISDGWSLGVLVQELTTLYMDFLTNKTTALPKLDIQYPDFALWEREMLSSKAWENQLNYWKNVLGTPTPSLKLVNGKNSISNEVKTEIKVLRAELVSDIKKVCIKKHLTLYMYLLAAFQILLNRYTGQEDIIVGSPVANRNRSETEGLIGCFINPLAIRINLDRKSKIDNFLKQVRQTVLDAFDNQNVPFEIVLDSIRLSRKNFNDKLFNVWFVLQNAPLSDINLPNLKVSNFKIERIASQFDIAFNLIEVGEEIFCSIDYSVSLFTLENIQTMLGHYKKILEQMTEDQNRKISEIVLEEISENQGFDDFEDGFNF